MFKPNRYYENESNSVKPDNVDKPNMNYDIKYKNIRLIDNLGENLGVYTVKDAIFKAKEVGLDLIEINPMANPPVCKIMDLGKYLFEVKKHKKETEQKAPENREIRLTPSISNHDLEIKSKKAKEFIQEGSKVVIQFKLKGREAKKTDIIKAVVERFYNLLTDCSILEYNGESYILKPKH